MTNQQHPITPPPELIEKWHSSSPLDRSLTVATQAARWGADQELEACVNYIDNNMSGNKAREFRAIRRPKPPSLKEQALESLHHLEAGCAPNIDLLRRALEQLDD